MKMRHVEWTKVAKNGHAWGKTELPDRSIFFGQKLVENAKISKFKCDILSNFQTLWKPLRV